MEQSIIDTFDTELVRAISNLVGVLENGRLVYINPAGCSMLGAESCAAVLGRELADFIHADYADLIALGIDAFAEEEAGVPLKLRPMNATPIDVLMNVRELSETGKDGVFMVECIDISNYIHASVDARKREQRLAGVLSTVNDTILTMDSKGNIQTINPAGERMFGYVKAQVLGQNISLLIPGRFAEKHDAHLEEFIRTGQSDMINTTLEAEGQHANGAVFPIELSLGHMMESTHHLFTGVIRDITQRKRALEEIRYLAHHDALTSLPNRTLYAERVDRAVARAKRSDKPFALMFVDLDKFKPINDALGHEAGDVVLKVVAERLLTHVRQTDTVARLGGDEFVAILESLDHPASAAVVAEKILASLREPITVPGGATANIGASIGISVYPYDGETLDALTSAADEAMYDVKEAGRDNYKFHSAPKA